MRILFDQGTPVPLREHLTEHMVVTAHEAGWATLSNGELLRVAEAEFDLLITTDKNLRHQPKIPDRRLAILVLPTTSWPRMRGLGNEVVAAVNAINPGQLIELRFPDE